MIGERQDKLVNSGGMSRVVDAMTSFPDSQELQEHGCRIIGNLAVRGNITKLWTFIIFHTIYLLKQAIDTSTSCSSLKQCICLSKKCLMFSYCIVYFIRWGFNLAVFAVGINIAKLNPK